MGMMGGGGPQPKGDIRPLWRALGLEIPGRPGMHGSDSRLTFAGKNTILTQS